MMDLKNLIKKIIRDPIIKFFRLFGYIILKKLHKNYAFNTVLTKLISDNHPLIFDIGAEDGASCERYSRLFTKPILHAFEPRPDQFGIMKSKFNDNKNKHELRRLKTVSNIYQCSNFKPVQFEIF